MNTEMIKNLIDNNERLIVKFGASWCGPCKMMEPVLKVVSEETGAFIFNIDIDQYPELANEYNIMSVPTMLIYKDKELVGTLTGARPKDAVISLLK